MDHLPPILLADDDPTARRVLEQAVSGWGYPAVIAADGDDAWNRLAAADGPRIAVLDWQMPGRTGVEICRAAQDELGPFPPYLILLTVRDQPADRAEALTAGADDFLTKPLRPEELRHRLIVARRTVERNAKLARRFAELQDVESRFGQLRGVLPTCSWCKKIKRDDGSWLPLEVFIRRLSGGRFGHGMCPECQAEMLREAHAELEPPVTDPS